MAGRKNPFEDLEQMIERMSRQFEKSMGGVEMGGDRGGASIDVADHGEEFVVTADVPGFRKEDIDVTLRGDRLQIRAEREEASEEGDGDEGDGGRYIRKERRHESVSRSVMLPEDVDEEGVSAEHRNGVLTVTLPKMSASEDDSHQIDIS